MDSARSTTNEPDSGRDFGRSHPIAARVLRQWRTLTGGSGVRDHSRMTMVACSGGPDSSALAAILALVDPKPVLVHILHDLRESALVSRDRDATKQIADQLGCRFLERSVAVKDGPGNTENNARTARYNTLGTIAQQEQIKYIATGHHADDQLETLLMRLMRGAGPRGLAGIQDARQFNDRTIIRPMLAVTRNEALEICTLARLECVHDHTNEDITLSRNAVRHQIVPHIKQIERSVPLKAATAADSCRSTVQALEELVRNYLWTQGVHSPKSLSWTRSLLRSEPPAALAELMRQSVGHFTGSVGLDQITNKSLLAAVDVLKDSSTETRECRLGPIIIHVDANQVQVSKACQASESRMDTT
ncbi:MAG: tRNA lysidine(34) synthetase TilS [Phycisphaerales bacterium]